MILGKVYSLGAIHPKERLITLFIEILSLKD